MQGVKQEYPDDGEVMVAGHLLQQGIRVKLRESIHQIDSVGVSEKRSVAVRRRIYHVKGPNEVWQIDGHHKLIKWNWSLTGEWIFSPNNMPLLQ